MFQSARPVWDAIRSSAALIIIISVSIRASRVGRDDEASGSFLIIYGNDSQNDSAKISLDWDEWDDLVKVVRKYRNKWEWK